METPRGDGNEGAPSADRGAEGWAANELADQGWASPLARLGLDRDPFAPGIDLDASVPTVSAERALDFVQLSLMQFSPATLLLGERGTGKTTAIHRLLRRLPGLKAGVVTLPLEEGGDLFEGILGAYGQTAPGPEAAHRRFEEIVAESYEAGRAMLLVVDDAHLASGEDLVRLQDSQRRMGGEVFPLLLLLVGELGLRDRLQDPDLAPLARRVEAITGLGPIGAQETAELVRRRLSVAEAPAELFEDEALAVIHEAARGVPGAVCLLAGLCLTLAAQEGHRVVDAALVRRALEAHVRGTADDADTDPSPPAPDPEPREEPDPEPGGEDDAPPTEPDEEDVLLPPTELPPAYSLSYQDLAELGSLEWEPAPPEEEPSRGPAEVAPPIAEEVAWAHEPADAELPWPWPSDEDAGGTTLPDPGIVAAEAPSGAEVGPPSEAAPAPPLRLVHPVALPKAEASGGPPSWEDDRGPPGAGGADPPLLLTGGMMTGVAGRHALARRRGEGSPGPRGRGARTAPAARGRTGRDLASAALNGGLVAGAVSGLLLVLAAGPEPEPVALRPEAADASPASTSADELFREALSAAAADPEAAAIAYARAAIRGHERAAYYLGQLYETGDGVPLDRARARAWYGIASDGMETAARRLAQLPPPGSSTPAAKDMTPVPLYSGRTATGEAELVWAGPKGADGFTVELARDPDRGVDQSRDVAASAARLPLTSEAAYWRVVVDGRDEAATPWLPIDAGRWVGG